MSDNKQNAFTKQNARTSMALLAGIFTAAAAYVFISTPELSTVNDIAATATIGAATAIVSGISGIFGILAGNMMLSRSNWFGNYTGMTAATSGGIAGFQAAKNWVLTAPTFA